VWGAAISAQALCSAVTFELPIPSSFPCQASCVDSKNSLVLAGQGVCCPLETFFFVILRFNCWWETFIPLQKNVEPWLPGRSWVMTDDVSFGWGHTSCNQLFSCRQFGDFFSRQMRDVCSSSLHKNPWQLSSTFEFYWLMTGHVLFGWAFSSYNQVFSCKQFGDFFLDRREVFVLHPSTKFPDSCQTLFNLLSDDWWCLIWMRSYKLQPVSQ